MPRWERKKDKNNGFITIPLRGKNTRINMPIVRFREKKGTIAGENREGTRGIIEGLTAFYRHHGFDPELTGSTKSFGRDLKGWEIKQVRLGNAGQFGTRAGPRALDEETKADNQKKLEKAIRNGQEQDANGTRRKRKRPAQDQDDVSGDIQAANKRPKKSIEAQSGGSSKQSREKRPSASNTQRYGTYGAMQPRQTQHYGGQSWPIQHPYEPSGGLRAQYERGQANTGQSFPVQPYVPQHLVRRDADYDPVHAYGGFVGRQIFGEQEHPISTEDEIEENRRLRLRQEIYGEPVHQDVVRTDHISNTNMSHFPHVHGSNDRDPKPSANTLGPGGRNAHQAPPQILGKRRQRDTEDAQIDGEVPIYIVQNQNPRSQSQTVRTDSLQEQRNLPASGVPALEPQQKRRRTNGSPVTVPEPQHRRQNVQSVRSRRPNQYGPGGAPQPVLPPEEVSRALQPRLDGNVQGSYISPEEEDRMLEDFFSFPTSETPDEGNGPSDSIGDEHQRDGSPNPGCS